MSVPHVQPLAVPLPMSSPLPADRPLPGLRLRLTPESAPMGYVDGGWWPRSRDLTVELPALIRGLAPRLGVVTAVAFTTGAWLAAPARLTVADAEVDLTDSGFEDPYVVRVSGVDDQHVTLLVIPPEADSTAAHRAMIMSARLDDTARPVEILAFGGLVPDGHVRRLRLVTGRV
jgi:hypothetical protein